MNRTQLKIVPSQTRDSFPDDLAECHGVICGLLLGVLLGALMWIGIIYGVLALVRLVG